MSIERIDKFDFIRIAYANTVKEIRDNKDKLQETELAIAISDKRLCVKIGNDIYSVPLTLEDAATLDDADFVVGGDNSVNK
ncbi:MAG: hypothetical protein ACRDDH_09290 [Cetobacterium sp.]|uniref:hypothetical protein n=1 Tax=Cetobacterium sp. TaxID=2071632 RepID=UPI003EE449D0